MDWKRPDYKFFSTAYTIMRILKALLIKEFIMLRRDAFLLRTIILLPLVVMLVLPLVAKHGCEEECRNRGG